MTLEITYPFVRDKSYLLAVSGGPDSVCMLDLMLQIPMLDLVVAHFNHNLREESDEESMYVRHLAKEMGLSFTSGSGDVKGYAETNGLSIEGAARYLRYQFLFHEAQQRGVVGIVVAHNADDQVETVLMHLIRGSGLTGLRGMQEVTYLPYYDDNIPIIRPMLEFWRPEIETYCRSRNLNPVIDKTNEDQSFLRNRIRHSIIPPLVDINPNFKVNIVQMANILKADFSIVSGVVDQAWKKLLIDRGKGFITLDVKRLRGLDVGMQRQVIRRALMGLHSRIDEINFGSVQRVISLLDNENSSQRLDLSGDLHAFVETEKLFLAKTGAELPTQQWPQLREDFEIIPGTHDIGNGWQILVDVLEGEWSLDTDPWSAFLDADLIGSKLQVRTRFEGDRFFPLGMDGQSMKLQDFFVNVKLPERARRNWPIVCSKGNIAWVPGYRIAHPLRITDQTKRVLKLQMKKHG